MAVLAWSTFASATAPQVDRLKQEAAAQVEQVAPSIENMADRIWEFAETGLQEIRSSSLLTDQLEQEGFSIERGVAQMPTAFVASYGSGTPVIGILAEYDALPGIGAAADSERRARDDGVTNGHGCGHNLLGAASAGGAIALKRLMRERGLTGTIKVFGTPAEEDDIGKLYMAKAGVFAGLDAAIEWHPSTSTATSNANGLALNNFQIEFRGKAAHASGEPEHGISALDALEMTTFGINLLREHVPSTTRIHYYIANGGAAPNIVPEYARLVLNVRDVERSAVEQTYARVLKIAQGAADAMGARHEVTVFSALHSVLLNRPLQVAMQANLQRLGPVPFDAGDQAFAHRMQQTLGEPQVGFAITVASLAKEPEFAPGSTDVAEVSRIAPTVGFLDATAPRGAPWHAWATVASHGTPAAKRAAVHAAKVIAMMGVDLLLDDDLLAKARADFLRATAGKPYTPGIPMNQKPPLERARAVVGERE